MLPGLLPSTLQPQDDLLKASFQSPGRASRPWVYWYFMDGNISREGLKNDLVAMRKAGIGGAIFLTVDVGIPRGPVAFMSPQWQSMVRYAIDEAGKNGIQIALGTGPGWCGAGGPWVKPENAMQDLVSSQTNVEGPAPFDQKLPQPTPRVPFFGMGSMTPALAKQWESFYRDEVVLAIPSPEKPLSLQELDEKSLVYRAPYSSQPGVKPYLYPQENRAPDQSVVHSKDVIDITNKMSSDGTLHWKVPPGKWTILRFGRTLTGQTTRPAPEAGLGFETDKFETAGIDAHIASFLSPLVSRSPGLALLHFDSWEMGSQNWSAHFRSLFKAKRGYDPLRFLPVMAGQTVDSTDASERFLWDLRQTSQELIRQNQLETLKAYGRKFGLGLSIEPYDMSPSADLSMGAVADNPQGEFWSTGFGYPTEYSILEAASIGHTNGKSIVGAESFTSNDGDGWLQHPGSMKAQTDWALAAGINRIIIHRYQHQPVENEFPGMTMGPYGVHWERTETWWNMVPAYHEYLSRCQELLRKGLPVADILYLNPEGAPVVFQPAPGSTVGELPDRRAYNFDACSPEALLDRAKVQNGRIVFPDGVSYRVLVLPRVKSMTPKLAKKIEELARDGATILGPAPERSPSHSGGPESDAQIRQIAHELWSGPVHPFGKGLIIDDPYQEFKPASMNSAKWIWTHEGDPAVAAPVGKRKFFRSFQIADVHQIASAQIAFTADNRFSMTLNQEPIASGTDFHQIQTADAIHAIRTGTNSLQVEVTNEGDAPNPAGLLGTLTLRFKDGREEQINTDGRWSCNTKLGVKVLGPWNMAPWGLTQDTLGFPPMYADYSVVARILKDRLHVTPDLDSHDRLRYIHRRIGSTDVFFVANRSTGPEDLTPTFRAASGDPEWWDPMTGETRKLPSFTRSGEAISIPLHLNGLQSGFVIFRGRTTSGTSLKPNFPALAPLTEIGGPWQVSFDTRFGGPKSATFPALTDWSKSDDPRIRYFSGEAHYQKTFDTPGVAQETHLTLSLGSVKNIASVRLNGRELGTTWCAPWQLKIPANLLKQKDNQIEITVANLWVNRLIGDSNLPQSERVTKTTWSPYGPDSPLQPSGLLGPVKILYEP